MGFVLNGDVSKYTDLRGNKALFKNGNQTMIHWQGYVRIYSEIKALYGGGSDDPEDNDT